MFLLHSNLFIMAWDTNLFTLAKCGWIELRLSIPGHLQMKGGSTQLQFLLFSLLHCKTLQLFNSFSRAMSKIGSTLVTLFVHFTLTLIMLLLCLNVTTKTSLFSTPVWAKIQNCLIYQNLHRHAWNHLVKEQSRSPCRKFHIDWMCTCAAATE